MLMVVWSGELEHDKRAAFSLSSYQGGSQAAACIEDEPRQGLIRAKATQMTAKDRNRAQRLRWRGWSLSRIAEVVGITEWQVRKALGCANRGPNNGNGRRRD